jgi:hypothetical protein
MTASLSETEARLALSSFRRDADRCDALRRTGDPGESVRRSAGPHFRHLVEPRGGAGRRMGQWKDNDSVGC